MHKYMEQLKELFVWSSVHPFCMPMITWVFTLSFHISIHNQIFAANDDSGAHPDQNTSPCFVHTNINEEGISVSMGDVRRKHVYTSSTNEVEIHVVNNNQEWTPTSGFIFEFEGYYPIVCSWKYHFTRKYAVVIIDVVVIIDLLL